MEALPITASSLIAAGGAFAVSAALSLAPIPGYIRTGRVEAFCAAALTFYGLAVIVERRWMTTHDRILAGYCLGTAACFYAAPQFPYTIGYAQQAVELLAFAAWATTGPRR